MASVVVFLVALPLCIGVAAASGVPVALGIITGIIGGLVVGFLPGSSLQVSGPAAGLAVLVLEFVTEHTVAMLGPVVLMSGLLQMGLGMLKMGRAFQSISLSVVQGMLAGIGLPLMLSQTYALVDSKQHGTAPKNIAGLPELASDVLNDPHKVGALLLGVMAVVVCFLWYKVPAPLSKVPAPLVVVMAGCAIAALPALEVRKVKVENLTEAINFVGPSDMAGLFDVKVLTMVVTFTVIASCESLFSAAAVDRMHTGARTEYNKELFAQGVGNTASGLLGAMPLTAVIVRSAANVNAGAKTKLSRILHGFWLLAFALLLPGLLGFIPICVLAGVLLHAGWKLFNPPAFVKMWKTDRGEGLVMFITTGAIVMTDLLEGVIGGLAVAVVLTALRMSHMTIRKTTDGDSARLELHGNATFLRMPKLIDALASVADKGRIVVDARGISHLDMACKAQLQEWADQQRKSGHENLELLMPGEEAEKAAEKSEEQETSETLEQERVPASVGAETTGADTGAGAGQEQQPHPGQYAHPGQHQHPQPETFRPYVPQAQPSFQFQHSMGQGYAHGHMPYGTQYARQHQHAQQHQHGAQTYGRGAHPQPQHAQHSQQVHLPHQAHAMHGQPYPQYQHHHQQQYPQHQAQQQPQYQQGPPPQGQYPGQQYPGQGQPMTEGYPQQPQPQGYGQPGDASYWGPEDDWAVQAYGEGTRR
ncbi:SulP family inorganic anion transporter [Streptomyces sp. NPDC051018]|uniref:SulP family inorganic anion transporter n=1 Tax=Streptomyces sp. NPDC051018 TaxID=3365639 RepID=UPI0037A5325E